MKFMTFNLRCPVPQDEKHYWPNRKATALQLIDMYQPDILGVQEQTDTMLTDMCQLSFRYYSLGDGRDANRHGERCTLYVRSHRFKVLLYGTEWLSPLPALPGTMNPEEGFPRIVTWAKLEDLHSTRQFYVYNTHFAYRSRAAQLENIDALLRIVQQHQSEHPLPAILMGDFNAEPNVDIHHRLRTSGWIDQRMGTADEHTLTFHGFKGEPAYSLIDYIYTLGSWNATSFHVDRRILNGLYPSDHYPIILEATL